MLALKVTRVGKGMAARFAPRYLTEASLFLHARGLDSLKALRSRSVPLAAALAFDGSLISARFLPLALEGLDWVNARVQVLPADGKEAHRLDFSCRGLAGTAARLLEFTGSRNTLRTGDLLLLPLGNEPLIPARGRHMSLSLQLPSGQWEKSLNF